jgi:large subunit ribosomal protein L18
MKTKFRRKKEGRTDYNTRINLLKSKFPRIVIRKSNRYIITQIVNSKEAQDTTLCSVNSKELKKLGWQSSFKNIPASYLTGILIGKKAKEMKINKATLDMGRHTSTKGSKIYAVVKGAQDAGLEINCDEKMLPKESKLSGEYAKSPEKIKKIIALEKGGIKNG